MDTKSFLDDLKEYAKLYKKSPETSREFFHYIDEHYEDYINATPDERVEIRKFIKGGLFGSKEIAYALLMYVKNRALPNLISTKDERWLIRALTAISMENYTTKFIDKSYNPSDTPTNADYLLADLVVTAEENGIDQMPFFYEIAELSDGKKYMREIMSSGGIGKLVYERKKYGKFSGINW